MQKHKSFTLVELLVVVSIIALLLAILMPSLKGAREQARQAVCLNNCHQIGLAMQEYCAEHQDRLPSSGGHGGDPDPRNWWLNVLADYVDTSLLYRCPKDQGEKFVAWNSLDWDRLSDEQKADLDERRWSSYGLNYLIVKQPTPYCDNMTRIRSPCYTIVVAESASSLMGVDHIHPEKFQMIPPKRQVAINRHQGSRANYLFADGHAAGLGIEETWVSGKRNWWAPATAPGWGASLAPPPPPPPPPPGL
ncbi:MAG: prepilin-type N-terminal cleavage/methylation domain-containing protein [Phycisphaerae bacterium]|nr:prepilin-type N-terminal cleavage/methylation domain-containing protein [Phycisphaerae bacterium]